MGCVTRGKPRNLASCWDLHLFPACWGVGELLCRQLPR